MLGLGFIIYSAWGPMVWALQMSQDRLQAAGVILVCDHAFWLSRTFQMLGRFRQSAAGPSWMAARDS